MKRRDLLALLGVGWLGEQVLPDEQPIPGQLRGASSTIGHMLRGSQQAAQPGPSENWDVVIVGSGISGLSAGWRLATSGLRMLMLDLEAFVGGTSSWGDDGAVPHPWGAHYLPVPERAARASHRLLQQLGILTGWDAAGRPTFDARHLCHAPEERLHYRGHWHDDSVPYAALSSSARADMDRFRALQRDLVQAKGNDGRYAFDSPAEQSSRDPRFLSLDTMSAATWLQREGFHSDFVHWYVRYATLDDFGADLDDVSAWAMLHYFAARKLEGEALSGSRYLVWPEGNGYLARALADRFEGERRHGALVTSVAPAPKRGVDLRYYDATAGSVRAVRARAVVLAVPSFILSRILHVENVPAARTSSPWLVANLHVDRPIEPNRAWDSVIYDSRGLGYVDAGHQRTQLSNRTVLTYFRAYGERNARATRRALLPRSWSDMASDVLIDLGRVHPELASQTRRLDIMLWGHAMPRPRPGFLGPRPFSAPTVLAPGIAWGHVDQTGFALFEEANLHGVRAAEAVAKHLGLAIGESWV